MSRLSFVKYEQDSLFNYEIGYDINSETAHGRRILSGRQTITEAALFANGEVRWKSLVVKPGLRYTWNSGYRSSFTPAVNLKYDLQKWTFRAGVASGFRSPDIKELYLEFVDINHNIKGNVDLKPEQSVHYQGWITTKRTVREQPLIAELNGYYQHVNNRISLAQNGTGTEYSYFNIDGFEAIGLQSSIEYRPGKHHVKLGASYTGTKSNLTLNGYAYSPEITLSAGVHWNKTGILFSGFYKYTGRMTMYLLLSDEPSPTVSFINDYSILDLNATRAFWNKKLVVSVGGKNLLNVTQVAAGYGPGVHSGSGSSTPVGWGTSVYVKLQVNIHYRK
jgi:outer membrane receptor for ferrienterochelin and colicins